MERRKLGAILVVACTLFATLGVRDSHSTPGKLHYAGYVERKPTPKEGLLAQIVYVDRYHDDYAPVFRDTDWNLGLRPAQCTGTYLGRNCAVERARFIDFFWADSKKWWRAGLALHLAMPLKKHLNGVPGYENCSFEGGLPSSVDKAKHRARLLSDYAKDGHFDDVVIGKMKWSDRSEWIEQAHALGIEFGPAPKDPRDFWLLAKKKQAQMIGSLADLIAPDSAFESYLKGMWSHVLTSTPAFDCWWKNTSKTTKYMPVGEVALSVDTPENEWARAPMRETMLSDCSKDESRGLCTRDALVHGLYVWDENHGRFGGKPELHPVHAITLETKGAFVNNLKVAVFTDAGKAAFDTQSPFAGYIDDATQPEDWYAFPNALDLPAVPNKQGTAFSDNCSFEWTGAWPKFASQPFTTGGTLPDIAPGKRDCANVGIGAVRPNRREVGRWYWAPGFVTAEMRRWWTPVGLNLSHQVEVVDGGVGTKGRRYKVRVHSEVKASKATFAGIVFKHRLPPAQESATWGTPEPSVSFPKPGVQVIDSGGLFYDVAPNVSAVRGYEHTLEVWSEKGGTANRIGEVKIELPRPRVAIQVTKRNWSTFVTNTPSPECPSRGLAKNSSVAYEATLIAKPAGLAGGKPTFQWTREKKQSAPEKVGSTGESVKVVIGKDDDENTFGVVAKDGAAGGPFESARHTIDVHSPESESELDVEYSSRGPTSSPIPMASVLPVPKEGQCNKIGAYGVTTRPVVKLVPDWEFEDLGFRNAKNESLAKPFCPQFAWHMLQARTLPKGAWTDVAIRESEAKTSSDGDVRAWSEGSAIAVKTTDGKPREFRVALSGTDALSRRAERMIEFDNWDVVGKGGEVGFNTAVRDCSREFNTKYNPKIVMATPMINVVPYNGGVTDPAMAGEKVINNKAHTQSKMRTRELMEMMQKTPTP